MNGQTTDNGSTYECAAAISRYIHDVNEVILKPHGYFYFLTQMKEDRFSYKWEATYLNTLAKVAQRFPKEYSSDRKSPTWNSKLRIAHHAPRIPVILKNDTKSHVVLSTTDPRWERIKDKPLMFGSRTEIEFTAPLTTNEKAALATFSKAAKARFYKENPLKDPDVCSMTLDYPQYCTPLFTAQDARGVYNSNEGMDVFLSNLTSSLCRRRGVAPPKVGWCATFNMAKFLLTDEEYSAFVKLHRGKLARLTYLSNNPPVRDADAQANGQATAQVNANATYAAAEQAWVDEVLKLRVELMALTCAMYPFLCYEHMSFSLSLAQLIGTPFIPTLESIDYSKVVDELEYSKVNMNTISSRFSGGLAFSIDYLQHGKACASASTSLEVSNLLPKSTDTSVKLLYTLYSRFAERSPLLARAQQFCCIPNLTKIRRAIRGGGHFWGWSAAQQSELLGNAPFLADYILANPFDLYLEQEEDYRLSLFTRLISLNLDMTAKATSESNQEVVSQEPSFF